MPVTLINSGRRPEYLDPEDDPVYQNQKRAQTAESIASLATAYQNYNSNKRDRTLMDELIQNSPAGPLAKARANAPSGAPLSPLETLIFQQQIKNQYPDTSKGYQPKTFEERVKLEQEKAKAKAGAFNSQPLQEGFIRVGNTVKPDPNYFNAEKEMKKLDVKELSEMQKALPKLDQANTTLDQLEKKYYEGLNPDKNPLNARAGGLSRKIAAASGFNPAAKTYMNNKKAFAGLISKGGFGETGVLTQQDIERVTAALPNEYSTKEEAAQAFEEVRSILKAARGRYEDKRKSVLGNKKSENQDPLGIF